MWISALLSQNNKKIYNLLIPVLFYKGVKYTTNAATGNHSSVEYTEYTGLRRVVKSPEL